MQRAVTFALPIPKLEVLVGDLERAEVMRYGYAVEYDFAPACQLRPTLDVRWQAAPPDLSTVPMVRPIRTARAVAVTRAISSSSRRRSE